MSPNTAAPASSATRGRTRGPHGRFSGANNHQWRSPLPRPTPRECRLIDDAEVQERVAKVLELELVAELDGRRLRRLNSIVNRYRLERRALASTGTAERYTSRDQVAVSLYGPDVDLNSVKRQMRRLEAILEAAGLLEVRILRGDQGEDRGLVIRLLDPLESAAALPGAAPELVGAAAEAVLKRRPETRGEARRRRHAPYCRQQSDRKRCGGVPGLYVRRRDGVGSSLEIATPGGSRPGVYGTTSLPQAGTQKSERDARRRARTTGGDAALENRGGHDAITSGASAQNAPPRSSRSTGLDGRRDREGKQGPHRWAALNRLRQIALRERGLERLLEEVGRGAPPCSIAVAIFEATFVADTPTSWLTLGDVDGPIGEDPELEPRRRFYRPITARWALRLEVACRQMDRLHGPGAGITALVDDVVSWRPGDGAPSGAQHDVQDLGERRGDVTRHVRDLGWPVSLAYFIRRLQLKARAQRRQQDPRRRLRSLDWRIRQERFELRPWGALGNVDRELAYFDRLACLDEDLEGSDHEQDSGSRPDL